LAAAQKIVAAAQAEAERKKLAGVMAVVDDGAWPILTLRMDNAAYVAWLDRRDEYMQQFCRLLVTG
jgi:glc operon protein GlcG